MAEKKAWQHEQEAGPSRFPSHRGCREKEQDVGRAADPQHLPTMMDFLNKTLPQGPITSQTDTNWGPSVQGLEPVGTFLIRRSHTAPLLCPSSKMLPVESPSCSRVFYICE